MLIRDNVLDRIDEAEPVMNFTTLDKKSLFSKVMFLTCWHNFYKLYKTKNEVEKLNTIIGKYSFKGKKFEDIDFFNKQYIWQFHIENNENALVFIYLSVDGLSIEMTKDCEFQALDILDELIQMILPNIENPFLKDNK